MYNLNDIKSIPIQDVCSLYGISLKQKGANWWGKLRENERTPSFSINPSKNIWRDWGISKGGDVISLVSEIEGVEYGKAISILGDRFGIEKEYNKSNYSILPTFNQYKAIGIYSKRAIRNMNIDLEKQSLDEIEKLEEKYSVSMQELAQKDLEAYHKILDKKALPNLYENRKLLIESYYKYISCTSYLDLIIYENMIKELNSSLNEKVDIYNKARLDGVKLNELKVDTNNLNISKDMIKSLNIDINLLNKKIINMINENKCEDISKIEELKYVIKVKENVLEKYKNLYKIRGEEVMIDDKELQNLYKEWRKNVQIEGVPFTWLGDEKNIKAFSEFANLEKPLDFHKMLDLESDLDLDDIKEFEVGKIYITNKNYNLEDGSFIKKGTSFYVISKTKYGYNIKFENNKDSYFENATRKYYIDEFDLEDFANPEMPIKETSKKLDLKKNVLEKYKNLDNVSDDTKLEKKVKNSTKDTLKKLSDKLEEGIKNLFESEKYKNYLKIMSKFHNYSFRNSLLIIMQNPEATYVAGFNKWNSLNRKVNKGEKGIKILAPAPIKKTVTQYKKDENGNYIYKNSKKVLEEIEQIIPRYKVTYVFDISQTNGQPLPSLSEELKGNVKDFNNFKRALEKSTNFNISYGTTKGEAKGYCTPALKRIMIKDNMSEVQTIKTLLHEIAHAELHTNKDEKNRATKEVEAESIAFIVSSYYGVDTSDYSFGYLAGWSSDKELVELKKSLDIIQKTAAKLIDKIDGNYRDLCNETNLSKRTIKNIVCDASKKAEEHNNKLEKKDIKEHKHEI